MIREKIGLEKGAELPGTKAVGQITRTQIREIATIKHQDQHLAHIPFEALCKSIVGSAASMGVDIVGGDGEEVAEVVDT